MTSTDECIDYQPKVTRETAPEDTELHDRLLKGILEDLGYQSFPLNPLDEGVSQSEISIRQPASALPVPAKTNSHSTEETLIESSPSPPRDTTIQSDSLPEYLFLLTSYLKQNFQQNVVPPKDPFSQDIPPPRERSVEDANFPQEYFGQATHSEDISLEDVLPPQDASYGQGLDFGSIPDNTSLIQYQQIPQTQDIELTPDCRTIEEEVAYMAQYVAERDLKKHLLKSWTPLESNHQYSRSGLSPHGRLDVPQFMQTFRQLAGIQPKPESPQKRGRGRPRKVLAPGEAAPRPNFNKQWRSKHIYPNGFWAIEDALAFLQDIEQVLTVQPDIKIQISEDIALRLLCKATGVPFPWWIQVDDIFVLLNGGYIRSPEGVWDGYNLDATFKCRAANCDNEMLIALSQKRGVQGKWTEVPEYENLHRQSEHLEDFRDLAYQVHYAHSDLTSLQ
ncbi:hypothetical protein AA313_de0200016 [Arthrobotrys entomopaga]|nr:hypothetical protein AA313_de0200016 [Arthrobotrys entomopaga]